MLKSAIKFLIVICLAGFIVSFIAAIFINYNQLRYHGWNNPGYACINNLRQIDAAAQQFALEHNLTNGTPINFPSDLTPYIKLNSDGKMFPCPQGGVYHITKVGEKPTCSLGNTVTPAHVLP